MAEILTRTPLTLTTKGKNLQTKIQAGLTTLQLVKVIVGDGYLTTDQSLVGLSGVVHEIPSRLAGTDGTSATVDFTRDYFDADEAVMMVSVCVENGDNEDTELREFAFIAYDETEDELITYGYANLGKDGLKFPSYDGIGHIKYIIDFPTAITNADNVRVNITRPAEVTWADLAADDILYEALEV